MGAISRPGVLASFQFGPGAEVHSTYSRITRQAAPPKASIVQ